MDKLLHIAATCLMAGVLGCSAPPAGKPLLTITARPPEINDVGEITEVKVVATDGEGKVGRGTVTITSEAGSLKDGASFQLDAYGAVNTPFSCRVQDDQYCRDVVQLTARWTDTNGQPATADVRVTILPPPPPPWERDVIWDANASLASCSGVTPPGQMPCTAGMCPRGFTCADGSCFLNGGSGGLQYTLRFGQSVDLDLHVIEPSADAGVCEVYWGEKNKPQKPSPCGALSSLDLDSNADCTIDSVNIENIIFRAGVTRPPPGRYVARVDLFSACAATTPISWELQVRAGGISRFYCGQFNPMDADRGGPMSGRSISTITIP